MKRLKLLYRGLRSWIFPHRFGRWTRKYFLTDAIHFLMRNISRSPLWSSWFIFLLMSYTFEKEYKQKSSVELLIHALTDVIYFLKRNISRSPMWSSWFFFLIDTLLIRNKKKSSLELLVYFPTDFIYLSIRI